MRRQDLTWRVGLVLVCQAVLVPHAAAAVQRYELKVQAVAEDAKAYWVTPTKVAVDATYLGVPVDAQFSTDTSFSLETVARPLRQCDAEISSVQVLPSRVPAILTSLAPAVLSTVGIYPSYLRSVVLMVRPKRPSTTESCSAEWQPGRTIVKIGASKYLASGSGGAGGALLFLGETLLSIEAK